MTNSKGLLVLVVVMSLAAANASATEIVFDDAMAADWSGSWHFYPTSTYVYAGTEGLEGDGQCLFTSSSGFVSANDYILQFYVNTKSDAASNLMLRLSWTTGSEVESSIPFDNRNVPAVYVIDDVDVNANDSGVATDADSSTWQKVEIDLSQTTYTGWPYEAHTYEPGTSVMTSFFIGTSSDVVLDEVRLIGVPEPATMSIVGFGALALLRRRRR